MASFYEKLSAKLQGDETSPGSKDPQPTGAKSVTYNAAGAKTLSAPGPATPAQNAGPGDPPAEGPQPEGTEPLMIDLFHADGRMVIFAQASGIAPGDFEVTADEDANTLLIQATQKRLPLPPLTGAAAGVEEKGRFVKQEIKWNSLYRKVYLPASFDASLADTYLEHGVLVIVLPVKKPGVGKKLSVKEFKGEEPKK